MMTPSRFDSFPALRRRSTQPSRTTATPAESYPRYSSRRKPSMRTGTTSLGPMYPIIPHIPCTSLDSLFLIPTLLFVLYPAVDVPLFAGAHRQRARGNIFADRGAASHVGAFPNRDRRDELCVAAHEGIVFDHSPIFFHGAVVAGDRPCADVHVAGDGRVAE